MRGYKIVARILLMLSVIDFALTAPALVRKHQVRAIGSNDGAGPSNPAPPIDSPSPSPGPSSTAAPPDEPHPLNPTSPLAHGQGSTDDSQKSNPSSPDDGPTHENYHLDINSAPPSSLRFKHISSFGSTRGTSQPPGSPQFAVAPESPPIVSSPDKSYSSSSWAPTGSDSSSPSPWASQARVRPPPNLPWAWSQPVQPRPDLPLTWSQPIKSHPNLPWGWSSRTRTRVPPPQNPGDHLSSEDSHPSSWEKYLATDQHLNSPDQLATGEPHPPTLSTDHGPSPIPGPTDYHLPPASPSSPGPSTEPKPPPSPGEMLPGEYESWFIGKLSKAKFKPRFSGSGSLNAAEGGLAGTFN